MEFKSNKGIFLQIADNLCHRILEGKLLPGERIPSVRDLAMELEVNRNTVMRTYSHLQDKGIIDNQRGIGFFVSGSAPEKIMETERKYFLENELPYFQKKIKLLQLKNSDLKMFLNEIKNND